MLHLPLAYGQDFFTGMALQKQLFLKRAQRRTIDKNGIVFFEGDSGDTCSYIESGIVRIFHTAESGKEAVIFLRYPGTLFGVAELMGGCERKNTAQALTPVTLHTMEAKVFQELLENDVVFSGKLISLLSRHVVNLGVQVASLMLGDVMERLINLLLYFYHDTLPYADRTPPQSIPICLAQSHIASMVGSTQPTISGLLRQLQSEGLISLSRMHICVLNPAAMQRKVSRRQEDQMC